MDIRAMATAIIRLDIDEEPNNRYGILSTDKRMPRLPMASRVKHIFRKLTRVLFVIPVN
jgi:hypothetical protein